MPCISVEGGLDGDRNKDYLADILMTSHDMHILHILVIVSPQFQLSARKLYQPRPPSDLNTWDGPRINYTSWATLNTTERSKYETPEPDTARLPGSPAVSSLAQSSEPFPAVPAHTGQACAAVGGREGGCARH